MKRLVKHLLFIAALYIIICMVGIISFRRTNSSQTNESNIAVNRIHAELSAAVEAGEAPQDAPRGRMAEWRGIYGENCPDTITFIPVTAEEQTLVFADGKSSVCTVSDEKGRVVGLYRYTFEKRKSVSAIYIIIVTAVLGFILCAAYICYIYRNILVPFRTLSDYPERLARLHTKEKLPESKSRYFGKYVWGMNMLCDMLEKDRSSISRLEADRRTLLASLAHGVKTPVANIRLYAQAMKMGMYNNAEDSAEAVDGIESNCVKLEKLTAEMLSTSSAAISSYEPEIEQFYLSELTAMVEREFSNRLNVKKIPYTIELESNLMINSDKWAIFRAISQFIENAVKYGSGEGITVSLFRQDDDLCICVRNKGELLPESELPYVFKSYWRGSNASETEGSGVGLYTAREVIKVLGGSIYARRLDDTSEMEFGICLEIYTNIQ